VALSPDMAPFADNRFDCCDLLQRSVIYHGTGKASTKGDAIVSNRPSVSSLSSTHDHFLFAPICEEANGMQLSVLSALARMDVDPWEEATRLAAMPKAIAERTLVSILDRVLAQSSTPSQPEVIATRLVQLLPQRGDGVTIAPTAGVRIGAQRTYWLVWLGFALALSLLSPRHQIATTNVGGSTSESAATSQLESDSVRSQGN
jgi:hypothetical protein